MIWLVAIVLTSCAPAVITPPKETVIPAPTITPTQIPTPPLSITPTSTIVPAIIDLKKLIFDTRLIIVDNTLVLDNSKNENWYGHTMGPFPIENTFRIKVQLSFTGEYAAIPIFGALETPDKEFRPAMIIVPDGRILFQNNITGLVQEIRINVTNGQVFYIDFRDPYGKQIVFISETGQLLKSIDVTKDLPNISIPNGLFPNGEFFFDVQSAPKSKLIISQLFLEVRPDSIFAKANNHKCAITIGEQDEVLSRSTLIAKGLSAWPDGVMGILRDGEKYTFIGGNPGYPSLVIGDLNNPVSQSVNPEVPIQKMKTSYNYASGGPVYRDEKTGILLMFYHAEKWQNGDWRKFYSSIGLAKSSDNGKTWTDLGEIIKTELPDYLAYPVDVGSGDFVIKDGYLYLYFRDAMLTSQFRFDNMLSVARAKISDVVNMAINKNDVVSWQKYYHGAWNESGLSGKSSELEIGNPSTRAFDVSYNEYLNKFIMIATTDFVVTTATDQGKSMNLYYSESFDGLHWSFRVPIDETKSDKVYPTIIGLGENPHISSSEFYIYYVHTPDWDNGQFNEAFLARRKIGCAANP